jgi:autotransporter family porin
MPVAVALIVAVAIGGVLTWRGMQSGAVRASAASQATAAPTSDATAQPTPTPTPTPSASAPSAPAAPKAAAPAGPQHFTTLPPGSALPPSAQCAAWVGAVAYPENKRVNRSYNQATGHRLAADFFVAGADDPRANTQLAARVDGAFSGTTRQVLRWTACKWGVDEDVVFAQAAKESWWRQTGKGDWASDPSTCAPGHGLGVDGQSGQCPNSFGILQNRYSIERSSWPGIFNSTAMNADTAYMIVRTCFEGYEYWLNTVERGRQYAAGDIWGCLGRMLDGRWHTAAGEQYAAAVQDYVRQRIWEQPGFQEG